MTGIRIEGELDPTSAWDGHRSYGEAPLTREPDDLANLRGGAAWVLGDDLTGWQVLRDPLGINKLFWARDGDGSIVFASRPRRLVDAGMRFEEVQAIPPGTVVDIRSLNDEPTARSIVPDAWFSTDRTTVESVEAVGSRIRGTLMRFLEAVRSSFRGRRIFVCLSGGLDSSGIAALACEVFPDVAAVSFDLKRTSGGPSDDRRSGERVARDLGIQCLDVTVTEDELLGRLDSVLVEGIDWRDFNVHAGLVNAALADGIADIDQTSIVLTGDLANEFLIDYEPEWYRGSEHYRLPRLRPAALRASLVRGLDTSNRELGIFAARGLRLLQPYAVAADAFLSLGEDVLDRADRKQALGRVVFGTTVPDHVYSRHKVRAQVGSAGGGGVLGMCLDRGIDAAWLRRRFCALHGIEDAAELDRFMRAGRYRAGIPGTPHA
jgi:asparagine synthetase B (glutamine-hydrolysing)